MRNQLHPFAYMPKGNRGKIPVETNGPKLDLGVFDNDVQWCSSQFEPFSALIVIEKPSHIYNQQ